MNTSYKITEIPFIYPFKTSHGQKIKQDGFIVILKHKDFVGYGEVSAIDYYKVGIQDLETQFLSVQSLVEAYDFQNPYLFHQFLSEILPEKEFLVCAFDIAAWDLYGKINQKPIFELWGLKPRKSPKTDYTIGIDSIPNMLKKLKDNPYPIYKIKLGTQEDLNIIKHIRNHTDSIIRIDANAGWSLQEALRIIPELAKLNVELIEQPLGKEAWEEMLLLKSESPLPLIADESCVLESDVDKCLGAFHGINIKLSKCGGITPALRMIEKARQLQLKIMMGCMNENVIGSAAIAQFLSLIDYADSDGPLLQSRYNATGLEYDNGHMYLSFKNGLGVEIINNF